MERKQQSEWCQFFVRGTQCDNYRMTGGTKCAVHGKGTYDRVAERPTSP